MKILVRWARVSLALMAVGTVLAQVLLPVLALQTGGMYYEVTHVALPYAVAAVLMMLCVQVALVGAWLLVSAVSRGTLFDPRTVAFIDAIRIAVAAAVAILAAVAAHLLLFVGLGGPAVVLGLAVLVFMGPALMIFLTLLKKVYLSAREDHAELEAVI